MAHFQVERILGHQSRFEIVSKRVVKHDLANASRIRMAPLGGTCVYYQRSMVGIEEETSGGIQKPDVSLPRHSRDWFYEF